MEHRSCFFRFADVVVDEQNFSVTKAGEVLPVEPKVFRVLQFLLHHAGRVVTKDELLDAVWNDCSVSESSLTRSVATLRRLLGDDIHEPRYIATVPTIGYRFLCDVTVTEDGFESRKADDALDAEPAGPEPDLKRDHVLPEAAPEAASATPSAPPAERPAPHIRPGVRILAACCVFLLLVAAGWFTYDRWRENSPASQGSQAPHVMPLTSDPGNEIQPSFAPDGNQVAYAFNEGGAGHYHIYVRAVGSEQAVRLTSASNDDMSPAWSPDGESIGFIRLGSGGDASVMIVPSSGGNERKLASIAIDLLHTNDTRVSWSPDGDWIATSEVNSSAVSGLILISAKTGAKKNLNYEPAKFDADLGPSFSPDGRYLAFARHISPSIADIFVLELPREEGARVEVRQLTHWNGRCGNPVWSADGQELLFIRDESGTGSRIWKVAAFRDAEARLIESVGEGSTSIAYSPRSNRLVYSKGTDDQNIWRMSLDSTSSGSESNHGATTTQLIASTRHDGQPQFSPDGRLIAFSSDRSGDSEIWIANSDGTGQRQLTRLHTSVAAGPHWSPDSKEIVFHSRPTGNANLYIVNVESGAYRQLTTGLTENYVPSWSHDGEWIYFGSGRDGGEQIWRMPASGGPAARMTKNGGSIPLEAPDGREVFYTKTNEPGLWMLSLGSGEESKIVPNTVGFERFTMGKRGVYFERGGEGSGFVISFMSFSDHVVRDVATINARVGDGLTVSPDERSIVYSQVDRSGSDLFLVDNFK